MEKVYIFDFDGVLVDSMTTWAGTYIKLLDKNNVEYPEDFVKIITPLGNEGTAKYCISLGLNMPVEEILKYAFGVFQEEYVKRVLPKNNVVDVLKKLKMQGCRLNVLTGSSHRYVDVCLKNAGIYDLFDNVWSVDDFGYSKAEPIIYKEAAKRIGVETSDCFFLDDNYIALLTAKEAGMKTIGVYDSSSEDFVEGMKETVDKFIYDFDEILN